jgi:NADH:ubiquinone oxidoreductase subunit 5 (subunit L)/multisubunit Na+/H+ antiporter MnhA subunit
MYLIKPSLPETLAKVPVISTLYRGSYAKWFVDEIYGVAFTRTFIVLSKDLLWANFDVTIIDGDVNGVGSIERGAATLLRTAQAGILRFYAALMALGAVAILIYMVVSARF